MDLDLTQNQYAEVQTPDRSRSDSCQVKVSIELAANLLLYVGCSDSAFWNNINSFFMNLVIQTASLLGIQALGYEFSVAAWLCKSFGTVLGGMHYKDLLGPMERVRYCIPVLDFYLLLHGLPYPKKPHSNEFIIINHNLEALRIFCLSDHVPIIWDLFQPATDQDLIIILSHLPKRGNLSLMFCCFCVCQPLRNNQHQWLLSTKVCSDL